MMLKMKFMGGLQYIILLYSDILLKKDKLHLMDFNRGEPKCYKINFHYASSSQQNAAFSHIMLRLTYIVHKMLDSRIEPRFF